MKPTRQEIFKQAARRLRQDFAELSTVPHSGLKGGEAERLVRRFLDDHMPKRFATGGGFIIDPRDSISKQTDVIVFDALNCPVYRASEDAGIFPNDNVAAVVEVKSRLDKEKLFEAADNIAAAKALLKSKTPDVPFLVQTQTLGCVFAFESTLSADTLSEHYLATMQKHRLGGHIDIVLVLDKTVSTLVARFPKDPEWGIVVLEGLGGSGSEGSHLGIGVRDTGEESLDAFFRFLLMHLTYFRGVVPHPGFKMASDQMQVRYFMSICHEPDPVKKAEKLKEYEAEIRRDFGYPEK